MLIDLIKNVVLTEKSVRLIENNQYTFDVDRKLTKPQIRKLIEDFFNLKVSAINTHILPRKAKAKAKRVIVTVKPGYSISLFSKEN